MQVSQHCTFWNTPQVLERNKHYFSSYIYCRHSPGLSHWPSHLCSAHTLHEFDQPRLFLYFENNQSHDVRSVSPCFFFLRTTIIDDVLNHSIVTTTYAPLTDGQIAAVLRTALNPSNRFLPINDPIRIPFLAVFIDALGRIKTIARRPYGRLLDELVHSYREILRIGLPIPQHRGSILWNLGVNLSVRSDEMG